MQIQKQMLNAFMKQSHKVSLTFPCTKITVTLCIDSLYVRHLLLAAGKKTNTEADTKGLKKSETYYKCVVTHQVSHNVRETDVIAFQCEATSSPIASGLEEVTGG